MISTAMASGRGRYRWRTWLRSRFPYWLSDRIPKGARDCGKHEWYRSDEEYFRCYHCEVGVQRAGEPIDPPAGAHPRVGSGAPIVQ